MIKRGRKKKPSESRDFLSGALMALPIVVGYGAIGIPFGILAVKAGLPVWAVALMSFFIFAGSAQFVAIQLVSTGVGVLPIMSATFILNLRHFLMGMSLGDNTNRVGIPLTTYLTQTITDETFGVNITKAEDGEKIHPSSMLGTNVVAHFSWIAANVIGAILGNVLPIEDKYTYGALPILFSVLLALQFKHMKFFILAGASVLLTWVLVGVLPGRWPFMVVALVVPTIKIIYEEVMK